MSEVFSALAAAVGTPQHHWQSAIFTLRGIPWWVWPLPFVIAAAVFLFVQTPMGWLTGKLPQEVTGLVLIGITASIAAYGYWRVGGFVPLFLALLTATLFLREWHFWGTNSGVYVAFVALCWWASMRRDDLAPLFRRPLARGLLLGALWTYTVSQVVDQHVLISLPDYLSWHNNVEELLENSGHLMLLAFVVLSYRTELAGNAISDSDVPPKLL